MCHGRGASLAQVGLGLTTLVAAGRTDRVVHGLHRLRRDRLEHDKLGVRGRRRLLAPSSGGCFREGAAHHYSRAESGIVMKPPMPKSRPIPQIVAAFVAELEASLRDELLNRVQSALAGVRHDGAADRQSTGRRPRAIRLTKDGLAARKRQGEYLGLLRSLRGRARASIKKIARERGVVAALKAGRGLRRTTTEG